MGWGGFSWKRMLGVTRAKSKFSRSIGIPLSKGGRQRKLGKIISGKGCLIIIIAGSAIPATIAILIKLII